MGITVDGTRPVSVDLIVGCNPIMEIATVTFWGMTLLIVVKLA